MLKAPGRSLQVLQRCSNVRAIKVKMSEETRCMMSIKKMVLLSVASAMASAALMTGVLGVVITAAKLRAIEISQTELRTCQRELTNALTELDEKIDKKFDKNFGTH